MRVSTNYGLINTGKKISKSRYCVSFELGHKKMEQTPSSSSMVPSLPESLFQSKSSLFNFLGKDDNNKEKLPPPPPPCVQVLPSTQKLFSHKYVADPVIISEDLTLFKGHVDVVDVFGVRNTDLVPGKYEGGLKLWESSIDLVRALKHEIDIGSLSFRGKNVLELGCGHGLPAIFACLEGASAVHFQDFNAEVLRSLTIPNVDTNLYEVRGKQGHYTCENLDLNLNVVSQDIRYYAGDWGELHKLLPIRTIDTANNVADVSDYSEKESLNNVPLSNNVVSEQTKKNSSNQTSEVKPINVLDLSSNDDQLTRHESTFDGYDVILMAETVYCMESLPKLLGLIKKCLCQPHGVVYLAAKRYYFGVGGGTHQFKKLVEKDGTLESMLVKDIADGASNVREIWKFCLK